MIRFWHFGRCAIFNHSFLNRTNISRTSRNRFDQVDRHGGEWPNVTSRNALTVTRFVRIFFSFFLYRYINTSIHNVRFSCCFFFLRFNGLNCHFVISNTFYCSDFGRTVFSARAISLWFSRTRLIILFRIPIKHAHVIMLQDQ